MKNTKNIIAMIMALITVASLFTSCDKQSNGQPSDSSTGIITTSETIAENVPTSGDESTRSPETTSEPETTEPETTEPETTEPAETYPEDPNGSKGLTFTKCEGGYSIVSIGTCTDKNIIIPRTHNGSLVVKVDKFAFIGSKAETIFVPETVKVICEGAFEKCYRLTQITLSEGIEEIGKAIFKDTYIETVVFPKSVIKYGSGIPTQYTLLTVLSGSKIKHITLGGVIDNFDIMLNNIDVETITFHEGYKIINSNAFDDCKNLKKIYLPSTIERVEWAKMTLSTPPNYTIYVNPKSEPNRVFYNHTGNLTRDVKVLAARCFSYYSFKTMDLHEGIISICNAAFSSCKSLESIKLPSTLRYLGSYAFDKCEKLNSITLPDELEYLGKGTFRGCKSLTSITLPDGIDYVGPNVVDGCTSLKYNEYDNALYIGTKSNPYYMLVKAKSKDIESVKIHKDTKIVDSYAFKDCSKLKSVTVPEGVRKVYGYAFEGCIALEYLYLPDSLEGSPYAPLYKCTGLKKIRLPKDINTKDTFLGCEPETDIFVVEGPIKVLGASMFRRGKIAQITLPDTLEEIKIYCFERSALQSITIPESVTKLGKTLFEECQELTEATINGRITVLPERTFSRCPKLETITLPNSIKEIERFAIAPMSLVITVNFKGTKSEFKAINFDPQWCTNIQLIDIICTDGTLTALEKSNLVSNAN